MWKIPERIICGLKTGERLILNDELSFSLGGDRDFVLPYGYPVRFVRYGMRGEDIRVAVVEIQLPDDSFMLSDIDLDLIGLEDQE